MSATGPGPEALLAELDRRGIALWVDGDRLGYRAPEASLTPDLLQAMRASRQDLLRLLRARAGEPFALSWGQRGLWFLCQEAPASPAYHVAWACRIVSALDVPALRAATLALVERHPALRTVFGRHGPAPVQRVLPGPRVAFSVTDARDMAEPEVAALVQAAAERPFDLERGPLVRADLVATRDGHVFLLTVHHLVIDGWSLWLLLDELGELYAAARMGRRPALPAPAATYRDLVAAEARILEGPDATRDLAYWRERLADPGPPLDLPTDRPRPAARTDRGASVPLVLDAGLTTRLRALARAEGVTLYAVLLAGFQALLGRYSGQEDVVVGSPVSRRDETGTREVVGYCINQVALRASLAGDPPFRRHLQETGRRVLEALEHQAYPFALLVDRLRVPRDPARTPLFQATFALQRPQRFAEGADLFAAAELGLAVEADRRIAWGDLTVRPYVLRHRRAWFDLTVQVLELREVLVGSFSYSTDLFDEATVGRMAASYGALLGAAVEDPARRVSRLSLETDVDARALAGTPVARPVPVERPLDLAFAAQATRRPDAVAVVGPDQTLTYGALDGRANRVAWRLRRRGLGVESIVGIACERSASLVVALLGVLKAGAAYLPLDPSDPDERLRLTLGDAGASLVLADPEVAPRLAAAGATVWCVEPSADRRSAATDRADRPPPATSAGHLAYVIYTSGSTGRPKGVQVTHASAVRLFAATAGWLRPTEGDVWALFHSPAFDFSVWELWGALLHGGRLVVVPRKVARSPEDAARLLAEERVTVLNQTPTAFYALADASARGGWPEDLALRMVIFGGEALDPGRLRPWLDRHGDASPRLVNMYGITETTVHVTVRPLTRDDADRPGSPVGRPIDDLRVLVMDRHLVPVPPGVAGELCVAGPGVARGYLGRPGLTADRFRPDPFGEPGARLYRSGDLCRVRPGPDLEYLGRLDQQVKIRGFRIEPAEIEAALRAHPAVEDACVVARTEGGHPPRLVGYVVPDRVRARPVARALARRREGGISLAELHELPNGLAVAHLNRAETAFVYGELFERGAYLRHGIRVGDGDTVVDVGANIGLFPLALAAAGHRVRVLAVEPLPEAVRCLEVNRDLYGLEVEILACALGREDGETPFTYYPHATVLSGRFADPTEEARLVGAYLLRQPGGSAGAEGGGDEGLAALLADRLAARTFTCPLRSLSTVIAERGLGWIDLLKIDVEKGELDVLEGITPANWGKIGQVVVEVHDVGGRLAVIEEMLGREGFRVTVDQDPPLQGTEVVSVYATRPTRRTARDGSAAPGRPPDWVAWASAGHLVRELRRHLQARLPAHMVPAELALLPALPLTSSGKVDRRSLPAPDPVRPDGGRGLVEPRTPIERTLAEIWATVLRLSRVGVTDNFFELGGDSILSIAVAARAQAAGLRVTSRHLFQHQTVGALAAALAPGPIRPAPRAHPPVPGPVPLSPVQRWFLDLALAEPHHFNQAAVLDLPAGTTPAAAARAVRGLLARHDALGLYLTGPRSAPVGRLAGAGLAVEVPAIDLSGLDPRARRLAVRGLADRLQASLDLERPPLVGAACLHGGSALPSLLLVAHHLLVDAVSWRILADDLAAELGAAGPGPAVPAHRPQPTTSYRAWVERLEALARDRAFDDEIDHWLALADAPPSLLSAGQGSGAPGPDTEASTRTVEVELESPATQGLLAGGRGIREAILAALLGAARGLEGADRLLVDLEGHGRQEEVAGDLDLSATVGWFTAIYPVLLSAEGAAPGADLRPAVTAALRGVPRHGLGYGALRYLSPDPATVARLGRVPRPGIAVNYLGRLDGALASLVTGDTGRWSSPRNRRPHALELVAHVAGDRLHLRWSYGERTHHREAIERLAAAHLTVLRDLAAAAAPPDPAPGAPAPRSFPLASLDAGGLRRLARALERGGKEPR